MGPRAGRAHPQKAVKLRHQSEKVGLSLGSMRRSWKRLSALLQPNAWLLAGAASCMILIAVCTAAYAWLAGPAVETLVAGETFSSDSLPWTGSIDPTRQLLLLGAVYLLLSTVRAVALYGQTLLTTKVEENVVHALRMQLHEHLLHLQPADGQHESAKRPPEATAALGARVSHEVRAISSLVHLGLAGNVRHVLVATALVGVAFRISVPLTLLGLAVLPLMAWISISVGRSCRRAQLEVTRAQASLTAAATEHASLLPVLQSLRAMNVARTRFAERAESARRTTLDAARRQARLAPAMELLTSVAAVTMLAAATFGGGPFRANPVGSLQSAASLFAALLLLYRPVRGLATTVQALIAGLSSLDRIDELFSRPRYPALPKPAGTNFPLPDSAPLEPDSAAFESITLDRVSCHFGTVAALTDVSLQLSAGEFVALAGPNGAGKSTLIHLLLGLAEPTRGSVHINGAAPDHNSPLERSGWCAWVPQQPLLLSETVAVNIASRADADRPQLWRAAKAAGADSIISSLPEGMDTMLAERGQNLSVGERQRICIARAMYQDAPVFLMDEPTAGLDSLSALQLAQTLESVRAAGRTIIVATHDPDVVRLADRTIQLDRGYLVSDSPNETRAPKKEPTTGATVLGLCGLVGLLAPVTAAADSLPAKSTVRLGRPAKTAEVEVQSTEQGARLKVRVGNKHLDHLMPLPRVSEAEARESNAREVNIREVDLGGGARVATVRVTMHHGKSKAAKTAAAIVTATRKGPQVLWTGHLYPRGDPRERLTDVLEVRDFTGDGALNVVVGTRRERTRICGQPDALLAPRAVDPTRLSLRPVVLPRLSEEQVQRASELRGTVESPGPTNPPLLDALEFVSASSSVRTPAHVDAVAAPIALTDNNPATAWIEGHGGDGTGEFVTARWESGMPIRAVSIRVPSRSASRRSGSVRSASRRSMAGLADVRSVLLVTDGGVARLVLPSRGTLKPSRETQPPEKPVWFSLPAPIRTRCLSVVLDRVQRRGAGPVRAGLAEVRAYTDLDFGKDQSANLGALIAELNHSDRARTAARSLVRLGARGATAIHEHWPALSPTGQRHAVRALDELLATKRLRVPSTDPRPVDPEPTNPPRNPPHDHPAHELPPGAPPANAIADARRVALETVRAAARRANGQARDLAIDALARHIDIDARDLPELLSGEALSDDGVSDKSNDFALRLAEHRTTLAVTPLLLAIEAPGGTERPALRQALRNALRQARRGTSTFVVNASSEKPDSSEKVVSPENAIRAWLAKTPPVNAQVAVGLALASVSAERAPPFEIRAAVRTILARNLNEAVEFVDRWRLVRAMALLTPGQPPRDAEQPHDGGQNFNAWLARQARRAKEWMLRREALRALNVRLRSSAKAASPQRLNALRHALRDPYPRVRSAAIQALLDSSPGYRPARKDLERAARLAQRDPFARVRKNAVTALAPYPPSRAVLRAAVNDTRHGVRAAAIDGLRAQNDRNAWKQIESTIRREEEWPEVRTAAVAFAERLCVKQAVPALVELVERAQGPSPWTGDVDVALHAVDALTVLGSPAARKALRKIARDPTFRPRVQHAKKRGQRCEHPKTQ